MINSIVQLCFNICAIFVFTTHAALEHATSGIFPLLYIGAICVSALYKCCTKIQMYEHLLITKKELVRNYLIFHLVLDITIITLAAIEYAQVNTGAFRLVAFLKLFDCVVIVKQIKIYLEIFKYGALLWDLLSVYLLNIFISHCVALIFIVMTHGESISWMTSFGLSPSQTGWAHVYIKSFYWATTTLMCSSFGDVLPVTTKETITIVLVEMVGLTMLAFWIGVIQSLLHQLRDSQKIKRRNLSVINRLMNNNQVPHNVQKQVKQEVLHMSKPSRVK